MDWCYQSSWNRMKALLLSSSPILGCFWHALPWSCCSRAWINMVWENVRSLRRTELGHRFSPLFVRWKICWYSNLARKKSAFQRWFSLGVFPLRMSISQAASLMGVKLATFGFRCHLNLPEPQFMAILTASPTHWKIDGKLVSAGQFSSGGALDELRGRWVASWWFGCHFWHFPVNLGLLSSSQLTFIIFFRGVQSNHQPDYYLQWEIYLWPMILWVIWTLTFINHD